MSSELGYWQQRLAEHFRELASNRSHAQAHRPVFALEHGLDASERDALARAIREHIALSVPAPTHGLPWVVYAAEVGYKYSGDEYWQTFEGETPGWTIHGNRYWIRDRYRSFQKEYAGAKPAGRWADWFTIICWPITHAILPRDLQRQLARILYEMRHLYSAELFDNPKTLGEFIATRSWNANSRFRNLVEETQLLGQISAALLLEGQFGTGDLIHPATLMRISEDLNHERQGREWLRGARQFAQTRAQIRGLTPRPQRASGVVQRGGEERFEIASLGIEPRLILRPANVETDTWEVWLEIPDLSDLLRRFPETHEILTSTRCIVAGAVGRPLARGRCLHGAQRVVLTRWPAHDEMLLQFERTHPRLDYLLRTECLLRPGPIWLFRIASDGIAYELRSLCVRPGERYIVVNASSSFEYSDHVRSIALQCEGIQGAVLDLPAALDTRWAETLRSLALAQAKAIDVWPAGLAAFVWDGEGHGEWGASEQPILGIRSDHPIDALFLSINDTVEDSLALTSISAGEPIFIELPQLSIGLHSVHVRAHAESNAETQMLGDLNVVMRIREIQQWAPGTTPYGPLNVQVDPAVPTLEQLWDGQVDIEVRGPHGRSVKCSALLFDGKTNEPRVVSALPPLLLPITPDRWRTHFDRHFRNIKSAQDGYDTARLCRLEFNGEELGAFTVQCEREFSPLRWVVRQEREGTVVRLLDDSGDEKPAEIAFFTFRNPVTHVQLAPKSEYLVSKPGGLFVACQRDLSVAVIAIPKIENLSDLRLSVHINTVGRSPAAVIGLLRVASLWACARSSGDVISARNRHEVIREIARAIAAVIGGKLWHRAERRYVHKGGADIGRLTEAVPDSRAQTGFAVALENKVPDVATAASNVRANILRELAASFRIFPPSVQDNAETLQLCALAFRLASNPGYLAGEIDEIILHEGLARLLEAPTLARAARFLVIATDRYLQSQIAPGELYASWGSA